MYEYIYVEIYVYHYIIVYHYRWPSDPLAREKTLTAFILLIAEQIQKQFHVSTSSVPIFLFIHALQIYT